MSYKQFLALLLNQPKRIANWRRISTMLGHKPAAGNPVGKEGRDE
jgi:hypothetical protein